MFVDVDGYEVLTVDFGSGSPPIVLIPGGIAPWEIWQQPMELLSRRHRVLSYDHYGAGLTLVPDELVTFDNQIGLLERLLDHWEVEEAVLVGDSNNAALAVQVALQQPDRCRALALVAGGVTHVPTPEVATFVAGMRSDFEATLAGFVRFCIPEPGQSSAQRWLAALIRRTGGRRAATLIESYYGVDLMNRLDELTMPTLILQGALDATPSTVGTAERMAAAIPLSMLEILDGTGHVPMLTRPEAVAEAIERLVTASV